MATVNLLVKATENPVTIYLRFVNGKRHDYTKSTDKIVNLENCVISRKGKKSSILEGVKKNSPEMKKFNKNLRDLKNHVIDSYDNTNPGEINADWLERQIAIFNGAYTTEDTQSELLTDAIQFVIDTASIRENSKGGLGLSKSRINSYKNLLKIVKKYQGKKKFKVQDIDIKFGKFFMNWMLNKRKYSESYSKKKIDDLKTVCFDAEINGVKINSQLKKVKGGKSKNKHVIYLSPHELQRIENTPFDTRSLRNVRKWLLLGCNIGQRGGDLLQINEKNFVTRNSLNLIELTQQKTGKQVTIPVLPTTEEILKEGLPYPISIQKFNDLVKIVCEKAKIDEVVPESKIEMVDKNGKVIPKDEKGRRKEKGEKRKISGEFPKYELIASHVCRRSFATNLYGILPTPLIMQITAHSTEKEFLGYIGKSSMDYAQQIADFYAKEAQRDNK